MSFKTLNGFQANTNKYVKESVKDNLNYMVLGLVSEAGEVADKIKKGMRDGNFDKEALGKELGDVLFYVAQCAHIMDFTLSEIAMHNIIKLNSRLERSAISGSGDER